MNRKILLVSSLFGLASLSLAESPKNEWTINTEVQRAWVVKNNVAIPNNATKFNFRDLTGTGSSTEFRGELIFRPKGLATEWRLMIAPFEVSSTGRLTNNVNFQGANFTTGVDTSGTYKFNSYRLSYRRDVNENWAIGLTIKVRDAKIALRQNATFRSKSDLGVVPLLNISGKTKLSDDFNLYTDFDGAWSNQGRAWDIAFALGYKFSKTSELRLGLRVLEGGANVPAVYNFSQINYVFIGSSVKF